MDCKKKSNCIFLLNKIDFRTVRIISFDDWLGPEGLFIDKNSNILTVAAELDRHSMQASSHCYIHVIKLNGTLAQKIEIDNFNEDEESVISYFMTSKFVFKHGSNNLNVYRFSS